ncbi:MAG: hypothetical protein IKI75_01880 [Lachnospiraceae bacterium]|nr:hypothetical protein [Lachnospiraceae bacterium]
MLTAFTGYINDNRIVVDEDIADLQGRTVVVTVLNTVWSNESVQDDIRREEARKSAALKLSGLWKNHENGMSVEEQVRNLRKGRRFDS